jgi:zinc carboxypeptidase
MGANPVVLFAGSWLSWQHRKPCSSRARPLRILETEDLAAPAATLLFSLSVRCAFLLSSLLLFGCAWELNARTNSPGLPANSRPFDFYDRGPYRSDLPRPSDYFGYEIGEFLTTYALYESLLREYQMHSDRLRVFTIGKTPEHRSQYILAISSPSNLTHLEEIKAQFGNLIDPRKLKAGPELDRLIQKLPIIVWLSYSIHGSESAAFEAGIEVLYQLLASNEPGLRDALDHTLILINPCQNPDGHERFVTWYNAHGAGRPEQYAFEHQEPWSITGRLNHNFFDLNRDLVSLSQPESEAATRAFLEWHPQVLADHHGQTKEYFFPPSALPINPNLPEKTTVKWLETFGKSNANAFDKRAWPYFVRERFDLFYPGYWDSWSSLHGATGMTYETDGGGPRGYSWRREDGTLLTLRDGVAKHVTAGLATVLAAATDREIKLRDYRDFFETALKELKRKFYLIPGKDPQAATELISLLMKQGIEISRTNADVKLLKASDYFGDAPGERTIPAGSFVVDTAQPYGRMAMALLEAETPQDSEFLKRQETLRKANEARGTEEAKQDYEFYDVTAWSLPLAMGVEACSTDEPVRVDVTPIQAFPSLSVDNPKGDLAETSGRSQVESGVAYVFEPSTVQSMRMAIQLLSLGYRVDTSNDAFRAAGKDFSRGSFILWCERNPGNLHQILTNLSAHYGVAVQSIPSSFPDHNGRGIASESNFSLKAPKVAVLADEPVKQTSYGLMLFLLAQKCGLEVVPVALENLTQEVLDQITVLILPDGNASDYKKAFEESRLGDLRDWINDGGVLVCIGGASEFVADPDTKLTSSGVVGNEEKTDSSGEKPAPEVPKRPDHKFSPKKESTSRKPIDVPGAIVKAKVNRNHFLTIGYDSDNMPLFVQGDVFLKPSETGGNALTFEGDKLRISGFFWEGNTDQLLQGSSALIDEPIGAGNVILFNFEPGFRMIWTSTVRLLLNAIVYGPSQPKESED